MKFIAQELREYMAALGVRTLNELVGRTDLLFQKDGKVDLSKIVECEIARANETYDNKSLYDFELEKTLDETVLLKKTGQQLWIKGKNNIEVKCM
jgi:glutamate synthase (ferredoxin)